MLTVAWLGLRSAAGSCAERQTLSTPPLEFAAAALVAFGVFNLSIDRAVAALYAGL